MTLKCQVLFSVIGALRVKIKLHVDCVPVEHFVISPPIKDLLFVLIRVYS